jgi:hypothetical protein
MKHLTQAVQRAISDIEQISSLKIDMKEKVATMDHYLPKIDFLETNNRISAIRTKRQSNIDNLFSHDIKRSSDIFPLLRKEFRSNSTVKILNMKPSTFVTSLYTLFTSQTLHAQTALSFTKWLSEFIANNSIKAKLSTAVPFPSIIGSHTFTTLNILNKIRPPKTFLSQTNDTFSNTKRTKRGISTVLKVMLPFTPAIGAASFVVKRIIDSLIMPSKYASKKKVMQQAKQLEQLRLGHNDIINAVNEVASQIASIDTKFDVVITSTAIASIESDLKTLIQYLETALQLTLLKYEAALSAAQDSGTSPYTLSQKDLIDVAAKTHMETRLMLDTNINNVRTSAIGYENKITFIIKIPILDDNKYFN